MQAVDTGGIHECGVNERASIQSDEDTEAGRQAFVGLYAFDFWAVLLKSFAFSSAA